MTAETKEGFSPPSRRQFTTNVLTSVVARALVGVGGIIVTGILARTYPIEIVGLWVLVSGVFAYISLADFGIFSSLPRAIPALQVTMRHGGPRSAIGTAAGLSLAMMVLLFAMAMPMASLLTDLYNIGEAIRETAVALFLAVFLIGGLSLPLRLGAGVLKAVHRYDMVYLTNGTASLVKVGLVVVLALMFEIDFRIVGILLLSLPLLSMGAQCGLSARFLRPAIPRWSSVKGLLPPLLSVSGAALAISLAIATKTQGPGMVASSLAGPDYAATVGLPLFLATSVLALVRSSSGLLTPIASGLSAQEDVSGIKARYFANTIAYTTVSGGVAALLIAIAPFILHLWLGEGSIPPERFADMVVLMQVFVLANAIATPGMMARIVMMATSRHWQACTIELGSALTGLLLGGFLFAQGYGVVGLALGLCSAIILPGIVILPALIARNLFCSFGDVLRNAIIRPLVVTLISSAVAVGCSVLPGEQSLLIALGSLLAVGMVWLTLSLALVVTRQQRGRAWQALIGLSGSNS